MHAHENVEHAHLYNHLRVEDKLIFFYTKKCYAFHYIKQFHLFIFVDVEIWVTMAWVERYLNLFPNLTK